MATPGADEASAKRKAQQEQESESSSDDDAGPQPAAPGQLGEDSDTDGEAGPAPAPVKKVKKRKLAHEKVMGTMNAALFMTAGKTTTVGCSADRAVIWLAMMRRLAIQLARYAQFVACAVVCASLVSLCLTGAFVARYFPLSRKTKSVSWPKPPPNE